MNVNRCGNAHAYMLCSPHSQRRMNNYQTTSSTVLEADIKISTRRSSSQHPGNRKETRNLRRVQLEEADCTLVFSYAHNILVDSKGKTSVLCRQPEQGL